MGAGGQPHRILTRMREDFPLSIHGVGLSIGSPTGLDPAHLARLKTVVDRAGFAQLYASSQEGAGSELGALAAVPAAVAHFALDALFERPVQAELVALLLLPKHHERFTSCVLVHGMGGSVRQRLPGSAEQAHAGQSLQLVQKRVLPRWHGVRRVRWIVCSRQARCAGPARSEQSLWFV